MKTKSPAPASARTRLNRGKKRAAYDRETQLQIIDAGFLCHVAFVWDGAPAVLPTCYGRVGDTVYVHGSRVAGMLKHMVQALPVSIAITHVDGLVLARSAFHHSANYRSVVIYGDARLVVEAEEKYDALRAITNQACSHRWDEVRAPNAKEMALTSVVAVPLTEMSAKVRTGPPVDAEEDYALPVWAGELPLNQHAGAPVPDPRLADGAIPLPRCITQGSSHTA